MILGQFMYYFVASLIVSMIVTGSMAERARLEPMLGYVVLQNIVIYTLVICWSWNLEGGWLREMEFFDRGGSIVLFHLGGLGGLVGSVVVGPRYKKFMREETLRQVAAGGNIERSKNLKALVEDKLEETIEVDELFLRKIRKLIKTETSENDFYSINVTMMVIGTILITIGWGMMSAAGLGTTHTLNSALARF